MPTLYPPPKKEFLKLLQRTLLPPSGDNATLHDVRNIKIIISQDSQWRKIHIVCLEMIEYRAY